MNSELGFPDDLNGQVLRRMQAGDDDLTQPRMVDFCFIFVERRNALAFAGLIEDPDKKVRISYYRQREMWQVEVSYRMVPGYVAVTTMEAALTKHAESVRGKADGWGCF